MESKFNVGDTVFYIDNDNIIEGTILDSPLMLGIKPKDNSICFYVPENKIFKHKDEAKKNLKLYD